MSFRFTEVAVCRKTQAELVDINKPKSQIIKGDLQVLLQMSTGMLLFRMGQFSYGVNPNDTVIYEDKDSQFKLLLCFEMSEDKSWVLKINQNVQLIFFVISERCKLIHRRASRILLKQMYESAKRPQQKYTEPMVQANYEKFKDLQISQPQQNINSNMTTSMMLVDASRSLSTGLAKAGEFIAIGLEKLGAFLSKRVDPSEQVVLSQETKKLIKNSNQGSKKILEITVEQFSALFRIARKQAQNLVDKFQKSEKGKQLIQKGDYTNYKKKLLTGIHIVANLYEGVTQGLSQAATGLTKGTTQVVGAKYGKDAGEATQNIIEGTRNIYKITDAPYNVATKQFNPTKAVIKKL